MVRFQTRKKVREGEELTIGKPIIISCPPDQTNNYYKDYAFESEHGQHVSTFALAINLASTDVGHNIDGLQLQIQNM